ncbi:MAG: dCTP deaminase [Patescibacteria group bacterium]
MFLSDTDIKNAIATGDIKIENFDETRLQPSSYDILLGNDFLRFNKSEVSVIDPKISISEFMIKETIADGDFILLKPQEFILGMTKDFIGVSSKYNCQLMGKSSLARLGLIIHTTAGFLDPGNEINLTLELVNVNNIPIKLYPGMKIGQVAFGKLLTPSSKNYGDPSLNSKYFGARSVQASEMWKNFKR